MLEAAGVPFDIVEAAFDEDEVKEELRSRGLAAAELAAALAERKALAIISGAGDLVLGSDQVLEHEDGSTLDKAESREELERQLRSLRGRPHKLHSAAVVAEAGKVVWSGAETVTLHMRSFSETFLHDYVGREFDEVRWSVGGYHAEGAGVQLFDRIEGSHFAVLGMPLLPLLGYLRERGLLPS